MSVLTLILAGGEGSRLSVLSEKRAKPAVPFAGKYRIIDFALSNAVNSDLYSIAVLTQYRPHSLMHHIGIGEPWDLNRRWPNGVQMWQPYRGRSDQDWYQGTADALYQNRNFIADIGCDEVLVLSGDHIYKQDYRELLRFHRENRAELTVGVINVRPDEVHRFGIMTVDGSNRIVKFAEKPRQSDSTLASMGVYVFNRETLLQRLEDDAHDHASAHDFGKNIIPNMVDRDRVVAFPFDGYWVDVGTVQAYWEANLALLADKPDLDLFDSTWTIHTRSEERPPAKFGAPGEIENSLVSNGCRVYGTVINSVLSPGVLVEPGAVVRDSVIMTNTAIGPGAVVDRCVIDKDVDVGAGARVGSGEDNRPNDREPANLSSGITVVGKRATIPPDVVIGRNCRIDAGVSHADFREREVPSGATIAPRAALDKAA
ncbi:MAG TPA: glucose-1-phosphate adenylyltransferase [Chloroflexota bacterium]|nr:glucose-1-phosphate adenylyltransferase [Chloroflexota bacterium]